MGIVSGCSWLNPRAEGAFEAISYIKEFLGRYKDRERLSAMLERELDTLISDIVSGSAVDFRSRLRNM